MREESDAERVVSLLKEVKDKEGKDLYTHIQDTLSYIAFTNPQSGIDKFEEISCEMRAKGSLELPERYLNYQTLALAAKLWLQSVYERYYEVSPANDWNRLRRHPKMRLLLRRRSSRR
eukprot:TRINITY_DN6248_c0_g2_i2.p1 TRINITY_DN6248_c0_g2~~TRINITY_DN6248_c0_g2_i2.p1  ORF type:complete len:118 (-),score=18.56 TRINITY_DN6248_c0_g2_i2:365-718(-)